MSASPSLVKRTIAQRDCIGSMILLLWLHASANLAAGHQTLPPLSEASHDKLMIHSSFIVTLLPGRVGVDLHGSSQGLLCARCHAVDSTRAESATLSACACTGTLVSAKKITSAGARASARVSRGSPVGLVQDDHLVAPWRQRHLRLRELLYGVSHHVDAPVWEQMST